MRGVKAIFAAAALLLPLGVAAQDKPYEGGMAATGDFGDPSALAPIMAPEPLTPEQQARLPLAQALADKVIPVGSMNSVMGGMFQGFIVPVPAGDTPDPRLVLARRLGFYASSTELTGEQATRIADLLDPAWAERERRERALTGQAMSRMMDTMEPLVRQAIAEMYAIHFTAAELADIDAFFATPSGAAYARQSYLMASDPRMTGTMMTIVPQALQQVSAMEAEAAAATADLPPQRNYGDLTGNQRKALAQLLGITVEDLEYTVLDAAP